MTELWVPESMARTVTEVKQTVSPKPRPMMEWGQDKLEDIEREVLTTVRLKWRCPTGDGGEMVYTGSMWPTGDPGYHHRCTVCQLGIAIHGRTYPRIEYEPAV